MQVLTNPHVPAFKITARPRRESKRSASIEPLEARIAPATFTGAAGTLTIDLNNTNEKISFSTNGTTITATLLNGTAVDGGGTGGNVAGFGTANASITSAGFTTINITDSSSNDSVAFIGSTGTYPQIFNITLDGATAGNLSFTGSSTFSNSLSATLSNGFVASDLLSSVTLSGAANLSLNAPSHDVLMAGPLFVAGNTVINANVIQLDNAANDFGGTVQLQGTGAADIRDLNNLVLAASSFSFGTAQTVAISAVGSISQTGAFTATGSAGSTLSIHSALGGIVLNSANTIAANVGLELSVTGSNGISFTNSPGANSNLTLADVSLDTGALTIVSNGSVTQRAGSTLETNGAVSISVASNNRDILLGNVDNHIGGIVTVGETGAGFLRDVTIRNAAETAVAPVGTPVTTAGDIRNLRLTFDNAGIALPAFNISGTLNITAGGDITQTGIQTIGGTSALTVIGDHVITMTNTANAFSGAVSLNAPQSTQAIQLMGVGGLSIGTSDLGRGPLAITAVTGNITQAGAIIQEKGAAPATFTVTAGNTILLTSSGNVFTGGLVFAGAGLDTVNIRNTDPTADFGDLTIPNTVAALTVRFDNAAVALPSLGPLAILSVIAPGIAQKAGTSISATAATFNSLAFPMDLSNVGNDFNDITLSNSGRNDVKVADVDDLNFAGLSTIGTGRLTVTAGTITDAGVVVQMGTGPVGEITFTSTGSITLNSGHALSGPVNVTVSGANSAAITNAGTNLVLGTVTTGSGAFTASASGADILQEPNSVLNLGGFSSFITSGGGEIQLNNAANSFGGSLALSNGSGGGDISIHATGAVILASSVTADLEIVTGGGAGHSITQVSPIVSTGTAIFKAGAGSITLNQANNFNRVGFFSTGPSVAISDSSDLTIEDSIVGSGSVILTAIGNFTSSGDLIQTTGTGAITLDTPSGSNVELNGSSNVLRGSVNVVHAKDIRVVSEGDITFSPGSVVSGDLIATAGGVVTLPTGLTNLTGLIISANSTTISSDVAVTSNSVDITGKVSFVGNRSLTTTTSNITFRNGLDVGGALVLNIGSNQAVQLAGGDWNHGSNPLTINGTGVDVVIGGGSPASFNMTSGTISMPGGGDLSIQGNAIFRVGSTNAAETVTVANGTGVVNFGPGTALAVGFGTTNDQLVKTGSGTIIISNTARLLGSGLAGASETPVLISQTGLLAGRFFNSVDAEGDSRDFFAGSDIVTPTYDFTQLKIKAGGIVAPGGSVSGALPDGDVFTVSSSLGAAAGLVVSQEADGSLAVVVRNDTAPGASKLNITTSGGGNGRLPVSGVMVHAPGAVSIFAPAADFTGSINTEGTLAALTSRDLGVSGGLTILDGGLATAKATITAHEMSNVQISLKGALTKLTAVSAIGSTFITADKFGTITITGDVNGSNANLPGALNPGNFGATLVSTTSSDGMVLSSAKIAGDLSGIWDLRGSVGKVSAKTSSAWTLGTEPSSIASNGGLLGNVASVTIGNATNFRLNSSGAVANLSFTQLAGATLTANSFGTIKIIGNLATGDLGKLSGCVITAKGNVGGIALKSLSVANTVDNTTVNLLDGDAASIVVKDSVTSSFIIANDVNNHGNLKSITAGSWNDNAIEARTIGTLKIVGNLPAGHFGDFKDSTVTLSGNTKGVALGTFETQGVVTNSDFTIQHGNVTTFKVGRELGDTDVLLIDPAFGQLTTIQAGEWISGVDVVAKSIGTLASVGAVAVLPDSPLLFGGMTQSNVTAYLNSGSAAAIGKIAIKGGIVNSDIGAERGIGSLVVGRNVLNSDIVADDMLAGSVGVGRIVTLTAGSWSNSGVSANTLGAVKIIGFATPEDSSSAFTVGDVTSGIFLAHGATPSKPAGVDSFAVAGIFNSSTLSAPSGIKTVTIAGLDQNSLIASDNVLAPAAGYITSLTVGAMSGATTRAGSIGTAKVIGNTAANLLGNVSSSLIAATSGVTVKGGLQALGTLSVNGDFLNSTVDAAANVSSVTILGQSVATGSNNRINAGYAPGSKLGSFSAGSITTTSTTTSNLISQAIGSITLKGNAARGFVGTADNAFIDILGSSNGVGLGTFTATGAVKNSLIRVSDGDVGSVTVARMVSSDLLVGFRLDDLSNITTATTGAQWTATNHKIGSFKTSAPLIAGDVEDSASFVDSNVIAGILGSVSITGVNPDTLNSVAFGVAFRASAGSGAGGVVKIDGSTTALTEPSTSGQFNYLGLAG